MFCPLDSNTGFIQLVGPIQQQDLTNITVKNYPLSISFSPRTTIPTLIGNRIDESTDNTCTYKGNKFNLVDVQICSVLNKGYILPGQTNQPVAELILSFSSNSTVSSLSQLSGILLCVPIYDSGNPDHDEYINQLINSETITCDYNNEIGSIYEGSDYKQINDSSLTKCVKSCCDDNNCLAYTFNKGTCYLKNSVSNQNKIEDKSIVSGTVNHNSTKKCNEPNKNKTALVPTLESIFYKSTNDTSQTSFAYKTCFETINNDKISPHSLYVIIFPNGIHLTQTVYQQLLLQMNGNLKPYMIPPAIREGDSTIRTYRFDDNGNKKPTVISQDGIVYITPISTCSDEFKNRFEYFINPPRLPTLSSVRFNTEQCPYYKTTQYKCVPFNQLKDLSGNYVIPGNKTLDTILYEQEQNKKSKSNEKNNSSSSLTTEQVEIIIAGSIGIIITTVIALKIGNWISNR